MRVKCDSCGKVLKEDYSFYVITLARVLENNDQIWNYDREADDSVLCLECGARKLP